MKALGEIGWRKAARFGFFTIALLPYRLALFPQLRAALQERPELRRRVTVDVDPLSVV